MSPIRFCVCIASPRRGAGDAGKWKERDNEIVEILPNGERKVRFRPTPAKKTRGAIRELCGEYVDICE